jgi:hypothetical protein
MTGLNRHTVTLPSVPRLAFDTVLLTATALALPVEGARRSLRCDPVSGVVL